MLNAFIRFCRPHTIIATTLQVSGLFILAGGIQSFALDALTVLLLTLVASLATNIYIVGLNQLADIEIDRINKPFLPLASGEFSLRQGRWIVILVALLALGLAAAQGSILLLTVGLAMIIGTAYSLSPLHLKSRPFWAAMSIAFVRGFVVNVGLFLHFHQKLQPATSIPWALVLGLALFFFGFGLVIALYKDIPDLPGDRRYGIRTFTVRLGPEKVFLAGRLILTAFYLVPITAALAFLPGPDGILLSIAHLCIVVLFWFMSQSVDLGDPAAITRFYMFLWGLFYVEYILLSLNSIVHSVTTGLS